ncbi:MAG: sarcinarray family MAST domain-containing protein [Methanosarcinales archaeon]|nr:sarcinarray family MAST domain-containing protein [Methanosarcinales archaeon]
MMKKLRILLILNVLLCLMCNVNANIDELVEYEVYYNDQTATVFNADLKVGEPATIKAVVYLKKNVDVSTGLTATGFKYNDPNQPYKVIEGPSEFTKTARHHGHNATETVTFEWIICPTDVAAGWTIPLNIDFKFFDRDEKEGFPIYFTAANICVSDERYSGSTTHTTTNPSSTGEHSSEGSPGFGVLTVVLSITLMVFWKRRK